MHRATPLMTSFRAYSAGGARATVDTVDDGPMMQEMTGNFMRGETRQRIEAPQNYGFTSTVLPAKKGKDGQIEESAEAFISFIGGNRSFPVAAIMDDRRHRPMGLKPGENAQYDDIGQMTLMRRNGLFLLSLDSEEEQQQSGGGGAAPGTTAETQSGSQQSKKIERMVSLRHVEKKKQERPKQGQQQQNTQTAGGGGSPSATALSAEQQAAAGGLDQLLAQQQQQQAHKHEGETVNTEVRCTKNRIEFRAGDSVVGYYDKGADTWFLTGKLVVIDVKAKGGKLETIGKTYLGLDQKDEPAPKVVTEGGPAKQTFAKVES